MGNKYCKLPWISWTGSNACNLDQCFSYIYIYMKWLGITWWQGWPLFLWSGRWEVNHSSNLSMGWWCLRIDNPDNAGVISDRYPCHHYHHLLRSIQYMESLCFCSCYTYSNNLYPNVVYQYNIIITYSNLSLNSVVRYTIFYRKGPEAAMTCHDIQICSWWSCLLF